MHTNTSDQASQLASNVVTFRMPTVATDNATTLRQAALAASYRVADALSRRDALRAAAKATRKQSGKRTPSELARRLKSAQVALHDAEDAESAARVAWLRFEGDALSHLAADLRSPDEAVWVGAYDALLDIAFNAGASAMKRQAAANALRARFPTLTVHVA